MHLRLLPCKDYSVLQVTILALGGETLRGEGHRTTGLLCSFSKVTGKRVSVLFRCSYVHGDGHLNRNRLVELHVVGVVVLGGCRVDLLPPDCKMYSSKIQCSF